MLIFANNATSTLKNSVLSTAVSLPLADGTGVRFPNPDPGDSFFVTLIDNLGNVEIVEATARVGDTLTVIRGRDGTTAKSFAAGSVVDHRVVAEVLRRLSPEALLGMDNGIAPLDADGRIAEAYMPLSVLTQAEGDARYAQLSVGNQPNGVALLDAGSKVPIANLPDALLTLAEGDAAYVKVGQLGAVSGVATLGADGKLVAAQLPPDIADMTPYAKLLDPVFSHDITVANKATVKDLTVTGAAVFAGVQATDVATTGVVTVKGGSPRGKLTLSTSPPSGVPAAGDEWIQHAA